MNPASSRPDLCSHVVSQPNNNPNYYLPPIQSAPRLSPLCYPSIPTNLSLQPPSNPPTHNLSSSPIFTRTYQQPLLSAPLPPPHQLQHQPLPPFSTDVPTRQSHPPLPTTYPSATNCSPTHPNVPSIPSPTPRPPKYPYTMATTTTTTTTTEAPHQQQQQLPQQAAPAAAGVNTGATTDSNTTPDRELYNIQNILDAGCVIDGGKIYNSNGHIICGVSNQHDKPCRRVGKCPFHLYREAVSASNSTNGVVDHTGTAELAGGMVNGGGSVGQGRNRLAAPLKAFKMRKRGIPPKQQFKRGWWREEHYLFLEGLHIDGRGCWKQIASIVGSRSPRR